MSILFITFSKRGHHYYHDASVRYRCIYPAENLNANNINPHIIHIDNLDQIELKQYTHIICHRPRYSWKLKKLLRKAANRNIDMYADIDDLLFADKLAGLSPAVLSNHMSIKSAKEEAILYKKALDNVTKIICSTDQLAKQTKVIFSKANISVIPNKMPIRLINPLLKIPAKDRFSSKIIRYLPGTKHHQHDFNHIKIWLEGILQKYPNINFQLIGDVDISSLKSFKNRVSSIKQVPYSKLNQLMCDSWATLAPLDNNVFNQCKSGLKAWESGLLGIPVIASNLQDMERLSCSGLLSTNSFTEWDKTIDQWMDIDNYIKACNEIEQSCISCLNESKGKTILSLLNVLDNQNKNIDNKELIKWDYLFDINMQLEYDEVWVKSYFDPTDERHQSVVKYSKKQKKSMLLKNSRYIDWHKTSKSEKLRIIEKVKANSEANIADLHRYSPARRKLNKLFKSPLNFILDSKLLKLIFKNY